MGKPEHVGMIESTKRLHTIQLNFRILFRLFYRRRSVEKHFSHLFSIFTFIFSVWKFIFLLCERQLCWEKVSKPLFFSLVILFAYLACAFYIPFCYRIEFSSIWLNECVNIYVTCFFSYTLLLCCCCCSIIQRKWKIYWIYFF